MGRVCVPGVLPYGKAWTFVPVISESCHYRIMDQGSEWLSLARLRQTLHEVFKPSIPYALGGS